MFERSHLSLMHTAAAMGGATPYAGGSIGGPLEEGTMGSAVRELQSKLNVLQYGPVDVDGTFGASTKQALQNFQQAEGLPVTGVLDAASEARLNQRILNVSAAGAAQPQQQAQSADTLAPARPWWQTALMVAGGIALVGGVIYLLTEEESGGYKRALTQGAEPKEIPGRYNAKGTRIAGMHRAEKCARAPGEDAFAAGEPLAAQEASS